ncbi:unnamed protein product, partial [Heterotrigona itama]
VPRLVEQQSAIAKFRKIPSKFLRSCRAEATTMESYRSASARSALSTSTL